MEAPDFSIWVLLIFVAFLFIIMFSAIFFVMAFSTWVISRSRILEERPPGRRPDDKDFL